MDPFGNRHRDTLEQALTALTTAVEGLGLNAAISGPLKLSVSGATPCPDESAQPAGPLRESACPLSQDVTIKSRGGRLWWCWVWSGPGSGDYESEPILPIEEVDEVARRVRYVVSLSAAT